MVTLGPLPVGRGADLPGEHLRPGWVLVLSAVGKPGVEGRGFDPVEKAGGFQVDSTKGRTR